VNGVPHANGAVPGFMPVFTTCLVVPTKLAQTAADTSKFGFVPGPLCDTQEQAIARAKAFIELNWNPGPAAPIPIGQRVYSADFKAVGKVVP
jgi:hypothetical protein